MPDDIKPTNPLGLGLDDPTPTKIMNDVQTSPADVSSLPKDSSNQTPGSPTPKDETKLIVTSSSPIKKFGGVRAIATILGILVLIGSVAAGVFLIQRQQLISTRAWDCKTYVFNLSRDGIVSVQNGSTRDEPSQQALVFINNTQVAVIDVPTLKKGDAATLGSVSTPQGSFNWRIKGTKDCENTGSYGATKVQICHVPPGSPENSQVIEIDKNAWETGHDPHNAHTLDFLIDNNHPCPPTIPSLTPGPSATPTATPTTTNTPTPSPVPGISAECQDIKTYDTNWNLLTLDDLKNLNPGDKVRLTVSGTATAGSIDKVKFTINGNQRPEVSNKKPGSNEFYDEYTVPEGITSFNVNAQIHHSSLGWF